MDNTNKNMGADEKSAPGAYENVDKINIEVPQKRGRGRPKGSKNKPKSETNEIQKNKKSKKKNKEPVLTKEEIELRDVIYRYAKRFMGYDPQNPDIVLNKYCVLRLMGLTQSSNVMKKVSEKSVNFGLKVVIRAMESHKEEINSAMRRKNFNGDDNYKINYLCKIIESFLNQAYTDLKNEAINKKIQDNTIKRIEDLQEQLKQSKNSYSKMTPYEKEQAEKEKRREKLIEKHKDLW